MKNRIFHHPVDNCCWCEKPLLFNEASVEHLKPRVFGGTDDYDNLDIACRKCNTDRSTRYMGNWGSLMKDRMEYWQARLSYAAARKKLISWVPQ